MNIAKYKVFVPDTNGTVNKRSLAITNVLFLELANYGLELDPNAFLRLSKLSSKKAQKFAQTILAEYTMGQLNPPLFKNWEERTSFTFGERVFQIFGYIFQFCGNDFEQESFMDDMKRKVDFSQAKKIELVSNDEFREYFENLVGSNLVLDFKTSQKLNDIFDYFSDNLEAIPRIKSAEIRIAALLTLSETNDLLTVYKSLKCNSVDVLRYAAAKKDFQLFKLPAEVKYTNLSWKERVAGFTFLNDRANNDFESICEDMGLNRGAWEKYFKHTHFFGQSNFVNRFTALYTAAFVSLGNKYDALKTKIIVKNVDNLINNDIVEITDGGNLVYRTFASRLQKAIDNKKWPAIKKLIDDKPGYAFRNLSAISNGVSDKYESDFIKYMKSRIKDTDINILFSILSIDVDAEYRIIDVKGATVIETAQYPSFIRKLQTSIRAYIKKTYGFSGKVKVSSDIAKNITPFLSKNANLDRGTKISIRDESFLYFYVHWIQNNHGRTDLDLSFIAFDGNWSPTTIAYYNQANGYMSHSGDFTDAPAPNGATEYGQIRLNQLPKTIKYIVPVINSYSGNNFDQNKEVRAGFYTSNDSKFALQQESTKYNLTQPAQMNCPFILDVEKKEVTLIDYNRAERMGWIAESYIPDLKKIISVAKTKNYISIEKLADMLSGPSKSISLTVTNNAEGNKEINPENLFSLFTTPRVKCKNKKTVKV